MNNITEKIKKQIQDNLILLYMKGTPNTPKCGFSLKAARILSSCTKSFTYIDVLVHTDIRYALPIFSNWPTFPQLWINKKLIGGCDIILDMHNSGQLKLLIDEIMLQHDTK